MLKGAQRSILLGAVLTLGCKESGRSLVFVELLSRSSISDIETAGAVVTQNGNVVGANSAAWSDTSIPLRLGVYVDKSVVGEVSVIACAVNRAGVGIAGSDPMAAGRVTPGQAQTVPIDVSLGTSHVDAKCIDRIGGTGNHGSGGMGGWNRRNRRNGRRRERRDLERW